MDHDDSRMIQLCQRLGFAGEALSKAGDVAEGGRQNFQSRHAVEILLPCLINRTHPAMTDQLHQRELGKVRPKLNRRGHLESTSIRIG